MVYIRVWRSAHFGMVGERDFQLVGTAFFPSFSDTFFLRSDVSAAPEPASLALLGFGLAGLGFSRRKRAS